MIKIFEFFKKTQGRFQPSRITCDKMEINLFLFRIFFQFSLFKKALKVVIRDVIIL